MRAASSRDSVWQEPGNYEEFLVRVACAQLIECFVMIRKLPGASCTSPLPPAPHLHLPSNNQENVTRKTLSFSAIMQHTVWLL